MSEEAIGPERSPHLLPKVVQPIPEVPHLFAEVERTEKERGMLVR